MATEFCPTCGAATPPGAAVCATCGAALAPTPGPAGPRGGVVALVLVAVGAVLLVAAFVIGRGGDDGDVADGGELFLEAAAAAGPDPFTEPVDAEVPASSVVAAVDPAGPLPSPAEGAVVRSGVAPPPGSAPYGGSGDDAVCDRELMVSFLEANPDRAAAWAEVVGVPVSDLAVTIRSLTPSVLLYDTLVTNHGFSGGRATPRQSVLQAGTAVLVDADGDPVARCRCGNPLRPPQPAIDVVLVGAPWDDFRPDAVVGVEAGVTVTVVVEVRSPGATTTEEPTSSETSQPPTSGTPPAGGDITDLDREAAEGLLALLGECVGGAPVTLLDVEPLEGFTGSFTILVDVGGQQMLFVYEPATGIVTEGDQASAQLLADCGVL